MRRQLRSGHAGRSLRSLTIGALFVCVPMALWLAWPSPVQGGDKKPVVTGAVQVTDNPNIVRAHMTPLMARNPINGELVIAEVDGRSATRECAVHISVDNGRSWFTGGGFMFTPFTDCSIGAEFGPHVMPFFDKDGVLNVAFAANDPAKLAASDRPTSTADVREDIPRNAYLARSTDGGRTFTTALVAAGKEGSTQTAYIAAPSGAVDPVNPRNIYVGWGQGDWSNQTDPIKTMVAASTDGGRTFAAPVEINNGVGADYPWLTVDRNRVVHASYWTRGVGTEAADPTQARPGGRKNPTPIMHAYSSDQGKTWQRNVIDPGSQRLYRPPVIAADPNSDALYAVWQGVPDPMNFQLNRDGRDRVDIYFRASFDGGRTWGDRVIVNDDPQSGVNHEMPNIAIAPNGRIDIAWYDYRFSPGRGTGAGIQDVFHASSSDRGKTFTPNVRITDRSIDRSIGVYAGAVGSGINVGIASTDERVFFAWQDSRNGRPNTQAEDIYFASLLQNGPELAAELGGEGDDYSWLMLVTGIALGAGLAMGGVWLVSRSRGGSGSGSGSATPSAKPA